MSENDTTSNTTSDSDTVSNTGSNDSRDDGRDDGRGDRPAVLPASSVSSSVSELGSLFGARFGRHRRCPECGGGVDRARGCEGCSGGPYVDGSRPDHWCEACGGSPRYIEDLNGLRRIACPGPDPVRAARNGDLAESVWMLSQRLISLGHDLCADRPDPEDLGRVLEHNRRVMAELEARASGWARREWRHRWDTLTGQARNLVRTAVVIGSTEPREVAAAVAADEDTVVGWLAEAGRAGWLCLDQNGRYRVVDTARVWLVHDLPDHVDVTVLAGHELDTVARYLDYHLRHCGGGAGDQAENGAVRAWVRAHRVELVAALAAGSRLHANCRGWTATLFERAGEVADRAVVLARAVWRAAEGVADPVWHRAVWEAGLPAVEQDTQALYVLLRRSAAVARVHEDRETVEDRLEHAASVAMDAGDRHGAVTDFGAVITSLVDRGRAGQAQDRVLPEVLDTYHDHRYPQRAAIRVGVLTDLGVLMLDRDEPHLAERFLHYACYLHTSPENSTRNGNGNGSGDGGEKGLGGSDPVGAWMQEQYGRASWAIGYPIPARTAWRRAAELTGNTADRERLEYLLALDRTAPLPPRPPNPNPDSSSALARVSTQASS